MTTPSWPGRSALCIASLGAAYRSGALRPTQLVEELIPALAASDPLAIWTHRVPPDSLRAAARDLERTAITGPLWGIPFAVKDNIDVAGMPTTAACPGYRYVPDHSATVVDRLLAAGALCLGKTNLDQFATGLVGVRSPHGAPPNPFHAAYVPGGSSSGSAAAVARGLASFALGTDTAGSGRVPAALSNTVGLKPSRGLLSTRGVVPACRSLDCVSIQALTVDDAVEVARVAAAYDPADPYSRPAAPWLDQPLAARPAFRFGVPDRGAEPLGDSETCAAFARAVTTLRALGGTPVPVDLTPLFAAARLLYEGPWVAERLAGLAPFVAQHPDALLPVIRTILLGGAELRATQVFAGLHELAVHRRAADALFSSIDLLVVPTVPAVPTLADVAADPIVANSRLGRYTNFVNLLDLAALAVPNGFRDDGLSTGITLIAPAGSDSRLAALGAAFHCAVGGPLGATPWQLTPTPDPAGDPDALAPTADEHAIAVVGAHLSGQPLNPQLTTRGARLLATARTAAAYRLYALAGTTPPKPGLVRVADGGACVELEIWAMPRSQVGSFLALVPAPLCLGSVELQDGNRVTGFLCEPHVLTAAQDITAFGGWRAYLRGLATSW